MKRKKITVLVVDDSLVFRTALTRAINSCANIEVIGTASSAFEASDKIDELSPDVVTLDVEMPQMNGIEFLKKLMPHRSVAVVVVSSRPSNAFAALDAGAVDFVKKPLIRGAQDLEDFASELCSKIVAAKSARIKGPQPIKRATENVQTRVRPSISEIAAIGKSTKTIIALGASTGGTEALQTVVKDLPEETPGILIVQHMPAGFTKMYAERLNRVSKMEVKEAQDGDRVSAGKVLIAAGDYHMELAKDRHGYYVKCYQGEKVSGHCPSVDVLFDSVADVAGENALACILTGMGSDGAKGLLNLRKKGAFTIGQDKESSVVYGMPMVAFNIGAVGRQAPLSEIPQIIIDEIKKSG